MTWIETIKFMCEPTFLRDSRISSQREIQRKWFDLKCASVTMTAKIRGSALQATVPAKEKRKQKMLFYFFTVLAFFLSKNTMFFLWYSLEELTHLSTTLGLAGEIKSARTGQLMSVPPFYLSLTNLPDYFYWNNSKERAMALETFLSH